MLFYRCGRMVHLCPSSTEVRTQPSYSQSGREQALRARRNTTCFRSSWPAFIMTSESLSQSSDRTSMCLRARYHQDSEVRVRKDPRGRRRDIRNCNMSRHSGELSNVAKTARGTQKHSSSTDVKEHVTILQSWWRPICCIESSCSK